MTEITQVRFVIDDESQIEITFDDSSVFNQPHNTERYRYTEQLNEWLDLGNTITTYDQYHGWTTEQHMARKVDDAEQLVDAHIQAPVTAYNQQSGTHFASIHNCASYINTPTYTHYQFCVDAWQFNVDVWEASRQAQIDIAMGVIPEPATSEEFITLLPVWEG